MSRPGSHTPPEVLFDDNANSSANPDNFKSTRLIGDDDKAPKSQITAHKEGANSSGNPDNFKSTCMIGNDDKAPNSHISANEEGAAAQHSSPIPENDKRATKVVDISSIPSTFEFKWSLRPRNENEPSDATLVKSNLILPECNKAKDAGEARAASCSQQEKERALVELETEEPDLTQSTSSIRHTQRPTTEGTEKSDEESSNITVKNTENERAVSKKCDEESTSEETTGHLSSIKNENGSKLNNSNSKIASTKDIKDQITSSPCTNDIVDIDIVGSEKVLPGTSNDERATKVVNISSIPSTFKFKWSFRPRNENEPSDATLVKSNMTLPECNTAKDAGEARAASCSQQENERALVELETEEPDLTQSTSSIRHTQGPTTEETEKSDEESSNITVKNTENESAVSKKCDEESTSEETTGHLSSIKNENGSELNNSNPKIAPTKDIKDQITSSPYTNDIVDIDKVGSEEVLPGTSSDELAATETREGNETFDENKDAASVGENDENQSTSDVESDCPICYEAYDDTVQKVFINTCMHKCCYNCAVQWIKTKPTCPLCRKIIVSIFKNVNGEKYDEEIVEHSTAENSMLELASTPTTGAFVDSLIPQASQQIMQPYRITLAQERDQLRQPSQRQPHLRCVDCGRVYDTVNELASHMRAHERERIADRRNEEVLHRQTLQCSECGRVCASGAGLASHMRAHERNWNTEMQSEEEIRRQESRCGECGRVCESASGLASHMKTHERNWETTIKKQEKLRPQALSCGECGRVCESSAGLASHMRAHERDREISSQKEETLRRQAARCGECGRVCESAAGLASHMRAHERDKEISRQRQEELRRQAARCGECGRVCDSAAGLASHMRAHERDKDIARQRHEELRRQAARCGECGRVCESAAGLASHMSAHERDKEIARQRQEELRRQAARCGECGRVCESAAGLASHMRAHDRDRQIARQRQEELATQIKAREREREREMERQRQEESRRSYSCGECGQVCGSGAGLASHMRSHERNRYSYGPQSYGMSPQQSYSTSSYGSSSNYGQQSSSYQCGMCGMVCGSGAGLASHMRAHMRR